MSHRFSLFDLVRRRRYLLGAVVAVIVCVSLILTLNHGGQAQGFSRAISTSQTVAASTIVASELPGGTSTLSIAPNIATPVIPGTTSAPALGTGSAALELQITAPLSALALPGSNNPALAAPAPPASETNDFAAEQLGWEGALAAGLAGARNANIVGYQITVPGTTFTTSQQQVLRGEIRGAAGGNEYSTFPDIGTVPLQSLLGQLQSNVKVLSGVLPPGSILASDIVDVPLEASAQDYALEVDLKVTNLTVLQNYEGDVVDGLETGLVGDTTAPAEGLAINVVDAQGDRASWWSAERAGMGSGLADPELTLDGGTETATFPNLTGGPAQTTWATGAVSNLNGYALDPVRGIGPVSIHESKTRVERELGHRTAKCGYDCSRKYASKRGSLQVTYVRGQVSGIESRSPQITLDGLALGFGAKRLHNVLRLWRREPCQGYVYTTHEAGPDTSVSFGADGTIDINVLAGSIGGACGLP